MLDTCSEGPFSLVDGSLYSGFSMAVPSVLNSVLLYSVATTFLYSGSELPEFL